MAKDDDKRPIIIIKKVKRVEGGHHGGAWKVAYADFVTAMMAFFLLLWLLNVTTEQQKDMISSYFAPADPRISESTSGAGEPFAG
ncbi:MAG TPA: flagellar motor protein MotB, partial [Alphaproteobacteria bacterium]|nr:flagellar motor protein MotB [Alphaproteobacteria bacterium]